MEMHNSTLASHATAVELQHATMVRQMREYTARLQQTAEQNEALQREIAHLRGMLQVIPSQILLPLAIVVMLHMVLHMSCSTG